MITPELWDLIEDWDLEPMNWAAIEAVERGKRT